MWRIISFSDSNGNVTEHLATQKSLAYFNTENNPHVCIDNITNEVIAFSLEATLNKEIGV